MNGSILLRYLTLMAIFLVFFASFIACGSQLYQVSMEDDTNEQNLPAEAKDPNSSAYGIHASNGWVSLPVQYEFAKDMNDMQKQQLQKAIKTWEKVVGKTLFKFKAISSKTGESFPDLYSSLTDGMNGYYLDTNWAKTQKPVVVLATTIWDTSSSDASTIASADISFNSENYTIGDSLFVSAIDSKEVVDMQSLALHELGHLLGLSHVDPAVDTYSIMNPQLYIGEGLTTRKVSKGDIERIQTIYGCDSAACDVDKTLAEVEQNIDAETNGSGSTTTVH